MLSRLSARWHEVLTAVVVSVDGRQFSDVVTTRVEFRALTAATIAAYWRSGEPARSKRLLMVSNRPVSQTKWIG